MVGEGREEKESFMCAERVSCSTIKFSTHLLIIIDYCTSHIRNVIKMISFCSQTHITSSRRVIDSMQKFCLWNWRYCSQNAFFFYRCSLAGGLLLCILLFNVPHKWKSKACLQLSWKTRPQSCDRHSARWRLFKQCIELFLYYLFLAT
jgi:hypothetical protein